MCQLRLEDVRFVWSDAWKLLLIRYISDHRRNVPSIHQNSLSLSFLCLAGRSDLLLLSALLCCGLNLQRNDWMTIINSTSFCMHSCSCSRRREEKRRECGVHVSAVSEPCKGAPCSSSSSSWAAVGHCLHSAAPALALLPQSLPQPHCSTAQCTAGDVRAPRPHFPGDNPPASLPCPASTADRTARQSPACILFVSKKNEFPFNFATDLHGLKLVS